jgi:RimJ/RimL family protein N-acetyltransferase
MYALEMGVKIIFSEDPARVLSNTREFLASQPILHNLVLSILEARVAGSEPGRYWVAIEQGKTVGVVLQSPLSFPATLTPMEPEVVVAMVDAIAEAGVVLPGVNADAATAASFAGQWTERCKTGATPFMGTRIYELLEEGEAPNIKGELRRALAKDRGLMIRWTHAFSEEAGEDTSDTELRVDGRIAAGEQWIWDDGETLSIAVHRAPAERVTRIAGVYTPPELRKHGYATACVYALSNHLRRAGYRCMLYTDLANPTSNSIYRRIGYRAVGEALRYRFE